MRGRAAWGLVAVALVAVALLARPARGGGLDSELLTGGAGGAGGPRAIGRAGASAVSEDGGAALFINPGGLVRRRAWRVQLGMRMRDRDTGFAAADAPGSPRIHDRAPAQGAPYVAAQGAVGPVVVGATYIELGAARRVLPRPQIDQPADDVARLFPHRYGGVGLRYQRSALAAGASMRALPWLGVGVSLSLSRVRLEEERHVWAGFAGRDQVGDATRDLALAISGRDDFVPGVHAGVLIAPFELPVEIAASMSYAAAARLRGDARLSATRQAEMPVEIVEPGASAPTSRATLPGPLVVRAAARYLGQRVYLEAGAALALQDDTAPQWTLDGVAVRDTSGVVGELTRVPLLARGRGHAVVRASADVEVVAGFLWLSTGYAYRLAASSPALYAPVFADLDSHTVAVGAEAQWSGLTVTLGYGRTVSPAEQVTHSDVTLVNPFDAGSAAVGAGTYRDTSDQVGAMVEIAWDAWAPWDA